MSRKTIQTEACNMVPEFADICKRFTHRFILEGKSQSCVLNYLRQTSKLVLHYKKSPLDLSVDELEEYLYLIREKESPSLSSFKHLVYGLRYIYVMYKNEELDLSLPEIEKSNALPVVLSTSEVKALIAAPKYLKHRLLLATIYDGGLRISELCQLKISDVDFDRAMLHIRQSKHKKDRYVPVSDHLLRGLRAYIELSNPKDYLFNGKQRGIPISRTGVRHIMRKAVSSAGIIKKVCVHSLRHSYATHLLESGLDIITVKNQLGHVKIETTMMYLHIAQINPCKGYGPLSILYKKS